MISEKTESVMVGNGPSLYVTGGGLATPLLLKPVEKLLYSSSYSAFEKEESIPLYLLYKYFQ